MIPGISLFGSRSASDGPTHQHQLAERCTQNLLTIILFSFLPDLRLLLQCVGIPEILNTISEIATYKIDTPSTQTMSDHTPYNQSMTFPKNISPSPTSPSPRPVAPLSQPHSPQLHQSPSPLHSTPPRPYYSSLPLP